MTFRFGLRSQANLIGVHKDLQEVAYLALMLSPIDFAITDGVRSRAEQLELFETNKTKTMHSRHLTGHAIDIVALVDGKVTWGWKHYEDIATAFKAAAARLNIDLEWGGDWVSFKDGPHFQLAYKSYPVPKDATAGEQA